MLRGSPSKTSEGTSPVNVWEAIPVQPCTEIGSPVGSAGTQRADWQTPLWQSLPAAHTCSSLQPLHSAPPQSRSLSSPLRISSLQCGSAQCSVVSQLRLEQSSDVRQPSPDAQGAHSVPPQSTAVSSSFRAPSVHWGSTQERWVQLRLTQSPSVIQAAPLSHAVHEPPQSTAVSSPLRWPSVQ